MESRKVPMNSAFTIGEISMQLRSGCENARKFAPAFRVMFCRW